jgi:hypothetical protein
MNASPDKLRASVIAVLLTLPAIPAGAQESAGKSDILHRVFLAGEFCSRIVGPNAMGKWWGCLHDTRTVRGGQGCERSGALRDGVCQARGTGAGLRHDSGIVKCSVEAPLMRTKPP